MDAAGRDTFVHPQMRIFAAQTESTAPAGDAD